MAYIESCLKLSYSIQHDSFADICFTTYFSRQATLKSTMTCAILFQSQTQQFPFDWFQFFAYLETVLDNWPTGPHGEAGKKLVNNTS